MASPAAYARRQFPGAASDTTIVAGISDSATSVSLTTASGWPTGTYTGGILVEFYSVTTGATLEKVWAASLSGTTLTLHSDGRGADGTSAIAHSSGVGIRPVAAARDADEANKAVNETIGKITAAGEILVGDGANSMAAVNAKTSGYILVGNGTTVASVAVSGDVTLSSAGEIQLAANSVGSSEIAADAVTSSEIATDAVGTAEIAALAVDTAEIADSAVTSAKIAAGTIVASDIADGTITAAKMASGALAPDLNSLTTEASPALTDYIPIVDVSETNASNKTLVTSLMSLIYPVGSVYLNYLSTNPGTLLGFGTWVAAAEGEAVVGKASSGTFGSVGSIGAAGAETVTLTEAQIPSHRHQSVTGSFQNTSGTADWASGSNNGGSDAFTDYAGGGGAHNNIQPSFVVYVWRRTA